MPRIGHKKSRNGCTRCKQRKIKCDEKRPCSACARWDICCSLSQPAPAENASPIGSNTSADDKTPSALSERNSTPDVFPHVLSITAGPRFEPGPDWTADLGLMWHYTTYTAGTLPGASPSVWEVDIPKDALEHRFLMHQVLAVSAFHMASLEKAQGQLHRSRAFQHQHHAIRGIMAEVLSVTPENRDALFVASSMLFIGAFAASAKAQPDVDDMLGVFALIRGVSDILRQSQQAVRQGVLGKFMQCDAPPASTPLLRTVLGRLPLVYQDSEQDRLDCEVMTVVRDAAMALEECVRRASTASPELKVAIVWPMTLEDAFLDLVRARNPAALSVVAQYCTVLRGAGSRFWFMQGWGCSLMAAVAESLPEAEDYEVSVAGQPSEMQATGALSD